MKWLYEHRNAAQLVVLLLLLLAFWGPWVYTLDGVPPPEWCRDPLFLLDSARCAGLVSGSEVLWFFGNVVLATGNGVLFGPPAGYDVLEVLRLLLLVGVMTPLLLPFAAILLRIAARDTRRVRVFYAVAWGLAAAPVLAIVLFDAPLRSGRFWGIWMYLGLALVVVGLEIMNPLTRSRTGFAATSKGLSG